MLLNGKKERKKRALNVDVVYLGLMYYRCRARGVREGIYRDYEGMLCQAISSDHGDCSFITTQIIPTGTVSDNIGFSFTTASDNAYLGKAQKHVLGMVARFSQNQFIA